MTENPADFIPMRVMIAANCGLMLGWTCGDEVRRRKNSERELDDLRERLEQTVSKTPAVLRMLKEQRGVLNDTHQRLVALTKQLQKQPR